MTETTNIRNVFACDEGHKWEASVPLRYAWLHDGVLFTSAPLCPFCIAKYLGEMFPARIVGEVLAVAEPAPREGAHARSQEAQPKS